MAPIHPSSYNSMLKTDFDEGFSENTCPDFWQMIWETDTKMIVMLCQIAQGNKKMLLNSKFKIKTLENWNDDFFRIYWMFPIFS